MIDASDCLRARLAPDPTPPADTAWWPDQVVTGAVLHADQEFVNSDGQRCLFAKDSYLIHGPIELWMNHEAYPCLGTTANRRFRVWSAGDHVRFAFAEEKPWLHEMLLDCVTRGGLSGVSPTYFVLNKHERPDGVMVVDDVSIKEISLLRPPVQPRFNTSWVDVAPRGDLL